MQLILIIAAGILLACVLLPLLGPIIMIALCIGVVVLLGYGILSAIGIGVAAVEVSKEAVEKAKTAKKLSFRETVKAAPAFRQGLASIDALLTLQGLRRRPVGIWYAYILNERFRNCYMSGAFRVEDGLNRRHLQRYLQKTVDKGKNPDTRPRAEALCREILDCHDKLCAQYQKKA